MSQLVKNPPAMQETRVRSLGREDPPEKGRATHSSVLAGKSHGQRSLARSTGSQEPLTRNTGMSIPRTKQPGVACQYNGIFVC